MVYHFFPADAYHLSINIIASIIQRSAQKHFFIIIGNQKYRYRYENLFKQHQFQGFEYYESMKDFRKNNTLSRSCCILLHAWRLSIILYLISHLFKNVNYVCWGGDFFAQKSFRQHVKFIFKFFIFHYFKSIVVLNASEYDYFKDKLKIKKLFNIPYISRIDKEEQFAKKYGEDNLFKNKNTDRTIVYLGNNGARIATYMTMLDDLYHLKEHIEIHCMIHYLLSDNDLFEELKAKAHRLYGDRCVFHMNTYEYDDYMRFMNECDIYICSHKDGQSGIGAIYNCFLLGKKVFIAGINYDYIVSCGFKVFHSDEIKYGTIEELQRYSNEDKLYNYHQRFAYKTTGPNTNFQKWEEYYQFILS